MAIEEGKYVGWFLAMLVSAVVGLAGIVRVLIKYIEKIYSTRISDLEKKSDECLEQRQELFERLAKVEHETRIDLSADEHGKD